MNSTAFLDGYLFKEAGAEKAFTPLPVDILEIALKNMNDMEWDKIMKRIPQDDYAAIRRAYKAYQEDMPLFNISEHAGKPAKYSKPSDPLDPRRYRRRPDLD
jgi:ATP-dependent phosphoenolpyruvate carboxykinase